MRVPSRQMYHPARGRNNQGGPSVFGMTQQSFSGLDITDSQYQVYSPFLRAWLPHLTDVPNPLERAPDVQPNSASIRQHAVYGKIFNATVPMAVEGFELSPADAETIHVCWPAGEEAAHEILRRFLHTKARAGQFGAVDPLSPGATEPKGGSKDSRVGKYKDARDRVDADTTSRIRQVRFE